jgi:putative nucleotidyltransferase with HDIG domain
MLNELISHAVQPENRMETACDNLPELAKQLAQRDPILYQHSLRMLPWIQAVAQAMNISEYDSQLACWAGLLHDIGKTAIPARILEKANPLSEAEWAVIKLHPGIGARMVPRIKTLTAVREIIHTHHEHYAGLGYPLGLTGDMIPLAARILSVVDAFAAMTENRPYRQAFTQDDAAARIRQESGRQFDPAVCTAFISIL